MSIVGTLEISEECSSLPVALFLSPTFSPSFLLPAPSTDCYRYQVVSSSTAVAMRGPNTQRSSCLWHLRAPQGSSTQSFRLELRMEWLLPECRDRLAVYDGLTPTDTHLITS